MKNSRLSISFDCQIQRHFYGETFGAKRNCFKFQSPISFFFSFLNSWKECNVRWWRLLKCTNERDLKNATCIKTAYTDIYVLWSLFCFSRRHTNAIICSVFCSRRLASFWLIVTIITFLDDKLSLAVLPFQPENGFLLQRTTLFFLLSIFFFFKSPNPCLHWFFLFLGMVHSRRN